MSNNYAGARIALRVPVTYSIPISSYQARAEDGYACHLYNGTKDGILPASMGKGGCMFLLPKLARKGCGTGVPSW